MTPFSLRPNLPRAVATLFLCVVLGLPAVTACSPFSSPEPPVADSTFSRVLVEFHLLTGRSEIGESAPSGIRDSILARYNVPKSDFKATIDYYSRHPKQFSTLYDSVVDTLRAIEDDLERKTPSAK